MSAGSVAANTGQTRIAAPRSCCTMSISVGAQRFGVRRRYDTGDGAVMAQIAGRCCSTPAQKCCAAMLRPIGPVGD